MPLPRSQFAGIGHVCQFFARAVVFFVVSGVSMFDASVRVQVVDLCDRPAKHVATRHTRRRPVVYSFSVS